MWRGSGNDDFPVGHPASAENAGKTLRTMILSLTPFVAAAASAFVICSVESTQKLVACAVLAISGDRASASAATIGVFMVYLVSGIP